MKRFLMFVGVAVVAAAMYVAASPASQQSKVPTEKQFLALKKQVATLSKTLKTVKAEAVEADGFLRACIASANAGIVPVNQFGASANGFVFGPPDNTSAKTARTALDLDPSATPGALLIAIDPTCVQTNGLRHGGAGDLLRLAVRVR